MFIPFLLCFVLHRLLRDVPGYSAAECALNILKNRIKPYISFNKNMSHFFNVGYESSYLNLAVGVNTF